MTRLPRGGTAAISVTLDPFRREPRAFVWRGRRRQVQRVVETWVIETGWWSDELRVSRRYSRVQADGRLFDLYYDRIARAWFLERAL